MTPSVVATVGTDHHPFGRLVAWVDAWAATHPDIDVFIQHGTGPAPAHAVGAPLVDPADLAERIRTATAVVTHGGLASIMQARAAGFLPVVLARDPAAGEHVDGHQQAFTAQQAAQGRIRLPATADDLHALLDAAVADPATVRLADGPGDTSAAVAEVAALVDDLLRRRPARRRSTRKARS